MQVAIVGNGVAGITAARTIRKLQSDWRITVISAETDHFFSRTALMYIYMGHMTFEDTKPYEDWFWEKNRLDLIRGFVSRVDTEAQRLYLDSGAEIPYDALILATGSRYNKFGWPGQELPGVQGLVSFQDVELLEQNTRGVRRGVVVGGGLIGIELAEMLRSRGIEVTFLVRESAYMDYLFPVEESELIHRQLRAHDVDLRLNTELAEILPGDDGRVRAIRTSAGDELECGVVGLTAGVSPNAELASTSGIEVGRGILIDRYFRTSTPHVYAVGDCAEFAEPIPGREAVEQLWYTGREHGEVAGLNVGGRMTEYSPGVFFNSAKFFDLEYQTYGDVPPSTPDNHESLVWADNDRLLRINYDRSSRAVVGFNVLGIRLRHRVCEAWVESQTSIDEVLRDLKVANFDPEFFREVPRAARLLSDKSELRPGRRST